MDKNHDLFPYTFGGIFACPPRFKIALTDKQITANELNIYAAQTQHLYKSMASALP